VNHTRTDILVGIFVLVGIACLSYLAIRLGKLEVFGAQGYVLFADFASVAGLKPGDPVEIAGVKVGRVEGMGLAEDKARLTLRIDDGVQLQEDVIASVRARLRLYRATVYPRLAKLRARLLPITARPTTPTSAFWFETEAGAVLVMLVNSHGVRGALGPPPSLAPAVVDRAPVPGCGPPRAPRHWVRKRIRRGFTRSGNS